MSSLDSTSDSHTDYSSSLKKKAKVITVKSYARLSTKGRMGRFAYFFYTITTPILLFWVMAAIAGVVGKLGESWNTVAYIILVITVLIILALIVQFTIKRCHDFNASGKITVLLIIPLAFIFFCLISGDNGINKYGATPLPASNLLKIGSTLLLASIIATATYQVLSL